MRGDGAEKISLFYAVARSTGKKLVIVLGLVLLGVTLTTAQTSGRSNRISQGSSAKSFVQLSGTVHPLTSKATDLGPVNPNLQLNSLTLNIVPSATQKKEIAALQLELQNPKSPHYHKWLTQAEYGALFGLTEADLNQLTSWLKSQGFAVKAVSTSRNAISFSGAVGQVESVFRTQLRHYKLNGEDHFANATALSIPAQFAGVVLNVRGVDNFRPKPSRKRIAVSPDYTYYNGSSYYHFLSPADWATIYNVNAIYSAGFDGTGIHVGVVGQTYAPQSDIDNFRSAAGLPATKLTYYCISAADCTDEAGIKSGDWAEADLDIEWAGGIARNATVDYIYASGADQNLGVFDALQYAIQSYRTGDGSVLPVISMSYVTCETQFPVSYFSWVDALVQQASLQGQTLLVSSGDSGAAGCDDHSSSSHLTATGGLSVEVPADSPNFTAVGGTTLSGDSYSPALYWTQQSGLVNSAKQYIPETAWNETNSSGIAASGGGQSAIPSGHTQPAFPQPTWQNGLIAGTTGRLVPDIAFAGAAAHDGYLNCTSDFNSTAYGAMCTNGFFSSGGTSGSVFYSLGGTSAAAPSFAGMLGLLVQRYGPLGNINPVLYSSAANSTTYATVFHDITAGNSNITCLAGTTGCVNGVIGYSAGTGYDMVTGLGSINGNGLYNAIAAYYPHATTTTAVTVLPNPATIGGTVTVKATVSSQISGTVTGTVTFSTASATLGSATVTGGVATLNNVPITSANGLGPGSDRITAAYSGDSNYLASTGAVALTVSRLSPIVTVTGGPTAAGSTVSLVATVSAVAGGTPTGSVTFTTGSATLGTAQVVAGVATLTNVAASADNGLGKGTDLVTASYSGDTNFLPASGSLQLLVFDPALPLLLSLSSESATVGGTGFAIALNGLNFNTSSIVLWNGAVRTTTYLSSTQLLAAISAQDISVRGTSKIAVANLWPNPGTCSALPFTVTGANTVATLSGASIFSASDGSGNHVLAVRGTNFTAGSAVMWNGSARTSTYVRPEIISATITATDFLTRPASVTVGNQAGTSPGFQLH
ncbi:MAG: hypothetical protein CXZ00_09595 [Acidobacteria bacterium]|nr:MAG: hypothetical protein CXZ00_09595 [Acidobacteriota bacterium]